MEYLDSKCRVILSKDDSVWILSKGPRIGTLFHLKKPTVIQALRD